jgi:hypothetical protein
MTLCGPATIRFSMKAEICPWEKVRKQSAGHAPAGAPSLDEARLALPAPPRWLAFCIANEQLGLSRDPGLAEGPPSKGDLVHRR